MNQRLIIIVIIVAIFFAGGVWFANLFPNEYQSQSDSPVPTAQHLPLFSDLRLGTPVRAVFATQKNPPIKQQSDYTVQDPIMLQGTTTVAATKPVSLSVRLIDTSSKIITLKPEHISLNPGTNSFCCWNITTAGVYTLQVLRPDSITTNLPITITRDLGGT